MQFYIIYSTQFQFFKISPMDFRMALCRWYFTESCKIFTKYTTITNVSIDEIIQSVFHRELQNIYCIFHNHRHLYSIGNFTDGTTGGINPSVYFQQEFFFSAHFLSLKPSNFFYQLNERQKMELPTNIMPTYVFRWWFSW